jgi:cytochrome c oxidase assembly factor CtaG
MGAVYGLGVRSLWKRAGRGSGISTGRIAVFSLAMIFLAAALISPLDALSEMLFSAHMIQHLLLVLVAAPLFVVGRFQLALAWALRPEWVATIWKKWKWKQAWNFLTRPMTACLLHAAALWIWHLPRLYEASLTNEWLHFLEHACFFLSALIFWQVFAELAESAYNGRSTKFAMAIFAVFGIAMVSGLLGVLIAFSPHVWYPSHIHEAPFFGLTALEDQQLAGTIMWVPAGVVYLACAVGVLGRWLITMDALESRQAQG